MLNFIIRRILYAIPTLFVVSIMSFIIIQLPPGDFLTSYSMTLASQGDTISEEQLELLRERYGLDQPVYVQYYKWMKGILLEGDFGQSLEWQMPVKNLIWDRIALSLVVSLSSLLFVWSLAIPIGIYSATKQYSLFDYIATFFGFLGFATPNFMLALVLMWIGFSVFGQDVGGLFSPEYRNAPWNMAKLTDMLRHLWIPMVVLGTAGTAALIRIMRANMLDEINQQYVETARAKGLSENRLTWKYPVRVALNPFVSKAGFSLPELISGETITAVVLSLPTVGPLLLRSLLSQDMYMAGALIMLVSVLTIIGTLLSDILLAWLDPRIRYE
jgi:peptide/nickel transport system permease protein